MNDFLEQLYLYNLQKERSPRDYQCHLDQAALEALENQIEAAMGEDFWTRYAKAALRCATWENLTAFRSGLRFGMELILCARDTR